MWGRSPGHILGIDEPQDAVDQRRGLRGYFTFSESPKVQKGEFSLIADGGATLTGRIVSPSGILGSINFPAWNHTHLAWRGNRKSN